MVSILLLFMKAERTVGNWNLHLSSAAKMLPYFLYCEVCFWDPLKKLKIEIFKVTTRKIYLKRNFERWPAALWTTSRCGENTRYQPERDPKLRIVMCSSLTCIFRWDNAKDIQERIDANFGEKWGLNFWITCTETANICYHRCYQWHWFKWLSQQWLSQKQVSD